MLATDSPAALDLRLHAPMPDVVVVRVTGLLEVASAPLFAERVRQQFSRAEHVVVDLTGVTLVDARGLDVLHVLNEQSVGAGVRLHVAVDDPWMYELLQTAGLDRLPVLGPCVELIVARLAFRQPGDPAT